MIVIWGRNRIMYYRAPSKISCLFPENATKFRTRKAAERRAVGLVFEHGLEPERVEVLQI